MAIICSFAYISTPDRRQSKMLRTLDEHGSFLKSLKTVFLIAIYRATLSPVRQQMAIKNSVSYDFLSTFVDSFNVFNCRLSSVISVCKPMLGDGTTRM